MFNVPAWHRPRYPVPPRNARSSGTSADRPLPARDERSLLLVCMKTARLRARHHHLQMSNSQAPSPRLGRAPVPFVCFRPRKMRGAERRQALVRTAAPGGPPRGRADLRVAGDHRRDTPTGAPIGALLRRFPYGVGPRFQQRAFAPPSASSWQEALVPPGGAPTPPECELARLPRGRRPSPRPGITRRRLPELGTASPVPTFRPAPRSRRLMSAPSSEQGVDYIPE